MDEKTCMVDVAKYFLSFLQDESCGKCVPCRVGVDRMLEIVTDITEGRGRPEQIELLEELGDTIAHTSLCGLGKTVEGDTEIVHQRLIPEGDSRLVHSPRYAFAGD